MSEKYELADLKLPENNESIQLPHEFSELSHSDYVKSNELSHSDNELSHSDYVKYLIDTQGRAMVPKKFHGKKYKTKKLKDRYTGPYKWMYRQLNHSQNEDKNFDFWKENLPAEYRNMTSDEFYALVEKVKNEEDLGIVNEENFRDLKAVNDFIETLEAYSPSARGGKSRKITKRGRKRRRTKRNTFLN
jgi:DNA-binding transcriptional regulator/RsmH inhibitor MraZ